MYEFVQNILLLEDCGSFRWAALISIVQTGDIRDTLFMRSHLPVIYGDINSIYGWEWVDNVVLWETELSIEVDRKRHTLLWPFLLTWINFNPSMDK